MWFGTILLLLIFDVDHVPHATLLTRNAVNHLVQQTLALGTVTNIKVLKRSSVQKIWLISFNGTKVIVKNKLNEQLSDEVHAMSIAHSLGIPVPRVIHHSKHVLVQTHVTGDDERKQRPLAVYKALGVLLRRLHTHRVTSHDSFSTDYNANVLYLLQNEPFGWSWMPSKLRANFASVRHLVVNDRRPAVLIHGDISADNVFSDNAANSVAGIIDWGDTKGSVPEEEFATALIHSCVHFCPSCYGALVAGYGADALDQTHVRVWAVLKLGWIYADSLSKKEKERYGARFYAERFYADSFAMLSLLISNETEVCPQPTYTAADTRKHQKRRGS